MVPLIYLVLPAASIFFDRLLASILGVVFSGDYVQQLSLWLRKTGAERSHSRTARLATRKMRLGAFRIMTETFVTSGSPSSLKTKSKGLCNVAAQRIGISYGEELPVKSILHQ